MKRILAILTALTMLLAVFALSASAADMPTPVALYTFDSADKATKDSSGNGNDLRVAGGEAAVIDVQNGKLKYNSTGILAAVKDGDGKDISDKLTSFTYTAEVKFDAYGEGAECVPFSTGCSWDNVAGGARITIMSGDGSMGLDARAISNWNYPIDVASFYDNDPKWFENNHRYTLTFDSASSTIVIYVDNNKVFENGAFAGFTAASELCVFAIGGMNDGGDWVGYGSTMTIDNVAVFDCALTVDQVAGLSSVFEKQSAGTGDMTAVMAAVLVCSAAAFAVIKKKK